VTRSRRLLPALLAALVGCGGSDAPVVGPTQAQLHRDHDACAGKTADVEACGRACERKDEASCDVLKNRCLTADDGSACFLLGRQYEREGDVTHASGAYRLACQGGQSAACEEIGDTGVEATIESAPTRTTPTDTTARPPT
jgi:hypothetical protein